MSIQPIASAKRQFQVQPRGAYLGTFAALRQCRKNGIPL